MSTTNQETHLSQMWVFCSAMHIKFNLYSYIKETTVALGGITPGWRIFVDFELNIDE
jgi:hypothetical protein